MWRDWVWRGAVLGAGVTAGYFAATLVLPLSTRGDPIYDTAMLRTRWYGNLGVVWCHLAALLAGVAALAVIVVEEGLVIRYGDLVEPRALAEWRLRISRWTSAALAGGMVFALWRARDAR